MNQNERNSRKRLNSLILLVAFTAVMLIVSTYAWFSTQKNVTIGGLEGKVRVAEGLQISLDGQTWKNSIDLGAFARNEDGQLTTSSEYLPEEGATFEKPYVLELPEGEDPVYAKNLSPEELLPASTTGGTGDGIGNNKVNMYWGNLKNNIQLEKIKTLPEENDSGYYAFDIFLQNSSASGVEVDELQLEPNSTVIVADSKDATGLQNTVRVAFALYNNADNTSVTVENTPSIRQIIEGTSLNKTIKDVAIWEPNADYHVTEIVKSNNSILWSKADLEEYGFDIKDFANGTKYSTEEWTTKLAEVAVKDAGENVIGYRKIGSLTQFSSTPTTGVSKIPTYALTGASRKLIADAAGKNPGDSGYVATYEEGTGEISDIYDWATPAQGLKKQVTLKTSSVFDGGNYKVGSDGMAETEKQSLISIAKTELLNDEDPSNNPENTKFEIKAGQYHKIRVYVWIEGQDVDATNFASLGSGLTLDIGFSKPGSNEPS